MQAFFETISHQIFYFGNEKGRQEAEILIKKLFLLGSLSPPVSQSADFVTGKNKRGNFCYMTFLIVIEKGYAWHVS